MINDIEYEEIHIWLSSEADLYCCHYLAIQHFRTKMDRNHFLTQAERLLLSETLQSSCKKSVRLGGNVWKPSIAGRPPRCQSQQLSLKPLCRHRSGCFLCRNTFVFIKSCIARF